MSAIKIVPKQDLDIGEEVVKKCPVCSTFVTELFYFNFDDTRYAVCGMECGIKRASSLLAELILKKPESVHLVK